MLLGGEEGLSNSDSSDNSDKGKARAELKPRPTSKKANARDGGGAATQARDGDGERGNHPKTNSGGAARRRSEREHGRPWAWEAAGGAEAPPHLQKS